MSVNVNRSVSDQFYRYKMPRLIAKVGKFFLFFFLGDQLGRLAP